MTDIYDYLYINSHYLNNRHNCTTRYIFFRESQYFLLFIVSCDSQDISVGACCQGKTISL